MVQIIRGGTEQNEANERIGFRMGKSLSDTLTNYSANKALQNVLTDKSLQDQPMSVRLGKLQEALSPYGQKGMEVLQNRLAIEQQQQQEAEQEVLGKIYSGKQVSEKELAKVSPQNQAKVFELQKRRQAGRSVYESLIRAGYPEETAALWQNQLENAPIGGQTDVIRNVNDLLVRSRSGKGIEQEEQKTQIKPSIDIPGIESGTYDLEFPNLPEPVGLKPADIVRQNEHREKTNGPIYTETVDRLNALDDEYREVKHLQDLNEIPDALPTGFEKWNVDWDTGDLRIKALATPETQDYVKTIARMARRAKDFFPGRVTNFDLDQFKQGFPTLANSPEGRRIIAEQLALGNRIAYLKDETLKAAYDHYGSGADPVLVKKYATENYRRLKGQLENQLKSVNEMARSKIESEQKTESKPSLEDIFG